MPTPSFWVIIPAAGSGQRVGAALPKQYLPLAGRTVIEWSLAPFLAHPTCAGIVLVLAANDAHWPTLACHRDRRILTTIGGAQRSDSVRAGLAALESRCQDTDWILVHDAARPCLPASDLQRLLDEVCNDAAGGLLAAPVVDTLKRADTTQRVAQTVSREHLWRAQTPQMFRHGVLSRALTRAAEQGVAVTDDAQAVELLGLQPRLVAGDADNFKITVSEDLQRAARILDQRG